LVGTGHCGAAQALASMNIPVKPGRLLLIYDKFARDAPYSSANIEFWQSTCTFSE